MNRRDLLSSAAAAMAAGALGAAPVAAQDTAAAPRGFDFDALAAIAKDRAARPFESARMTMSGTFADLTYDQYRAIRFRRDRDPWQGQGDFAIDLLPPGLIFHEAVEINLVSGNVVTPLPFLPDTFEFDPALFPDGIDTDDVKGLSWSGFRLRAPLNRPDVMDEFLVFQGASYFRAVARNTLYGLSARGLALGTGSAAGEEFPIFRAFWVHKPESRARSVRIHALLDSPSVAGGFEFIVSPGADTVVETRCALFPRKDLDNVGIAPLTSMYWFGPEDRATVDDYRPRVHDSNGLQMLTGRETRLWRSLNNPATLQISAFMDEDPRGFGLAQRPRAFAHYEDSEARYEKRPSAWISPRGKWGKGTVTLVEIPANNEFNDNIVAYWQPALTLKAGRRYDFAYGLTFAPLPPDLAPVSRVVQTLSGLSVNDPKRRSFVIDFDAQTLAERELTPVVTASKGTVEGVHIILLPDEDRIRLAFSFIPQGAKLAELTARLDGPNGPLSETWLSRWTEG